MTTNNFPNIGYTTLGRDFNFYQKISVTATSFGGNSVDGYQPDLIITFPTNTVLFFSEGSGASAVVEYSFSGTQLHGEMDPSKSTGSLSFPNRSVSKIWFRIKSGSSGPVNIRVDAWGNR